MRFWRDVGEAMTEAFEERRLVDEMFVAFSAGFRDLLEAVRRLTPDEMAVVLERSHR